MLMTFLTVFLIALALSLDAFASSISCGIKLRRIQLLNFLKIAGTFGLFQAVMPLLGWSLGNVIKAYVQTFASGIAAAVFAALAAKTLYDAFFGKPEGACGAAACRECQCRKPSCLLLLAVATSIDAFVIGLLFALYQVPLLTSVLLIGAVTFVMSLAGCFIGNRARHYFGKWSEIIAGLLLLALAVKALLG